MRALARLNTWLFPSLPPVSSPVATSTLDSLAALTIERYAAITQSFSEYRIGKPIWLDRDPSVYDTEAYRRLSLIFRCVGIIAHAAGTAPLRVYDEAKDDDELPDHPLRRLVRQPNATQGEAIFWANVTVRAAIAGFCVVEKERNRLGGVIALNPLRSAWLKAIPRGRGVFDWEYRIPGQTTVYPLKAQNVVVFRWADTPDGSPYGIGPIATCIRDAGLLTKMTDFLGNLFDRGGVPLYGLIPADDVEIKDQGTADAMLEGFLQRRGGLNRAGIPMLLEGIKGVERMQMDLDELAYTDLRDVSELEIVRAFGIPPRKAITRVGLEHTTQNATASVEDGEFYRDVIVPLWTRYDDAATTSLLPEFEALPTSIYLGFDTSDIQALQEDRNAKAIWVIQGFTGGGLSQHTMHRELGIPLPETDDFYLRSIAVEAIPADDPLGLKVTPSTTTTAPPAVTTTPPPQLGTEPPIYALGDGTFLVGGIRTVGEGNARAVAATAVSLNDHGPSERLAKIGAANRKAHIAIAKARQPSIAAYFTALGKRVTKSVELRAKWFGREQDVVLLPGQTIESWRSQRFSAVEIDWDAEEKTLADILKRLYLLAGKTSFANAADQLGVEIAWDISNPKIKEVLGKLARNVTGITEESRTKIAEIVARAAEQGKTIDELKADLKATFDGWSDSRAETCARTESMVAYSKASLAAYEETGVVPKVQFLDNADHTEDYGASDGLTCAQRDGLIVAIEDAEKHVDAEHPRGSLVCVPIIDDGEE